MPRGDGKPLIKWGVIYKHEKTIFPSKEERDLFVSKHPNCAYARVVTGVWQLGR
jgi:hypothetical protein